MRSEYNANNQLSTSAKELQETRQQWERVLQPRGNADKGFYRTFKKGELRLKKEAHQNIGILVLLAIALLVVNYIQFL